MILTTLIDIAGTAGWVVILLPLVVLAVVVVGVIAGRDRAAREPDPEHEAAAPGASPADPPSREDAAGGASNDPDGTALDLRSQDPPPRHAPALGTAPPAAFVTRHETPSAPAVARQPWTDLEGDKKSPSANLSAREAELVEAEQRFDDAAVARLSLQLARDLIASDAPSSEAQTHLRRAIILASRLKDDATHAAARLELGDIMQSDGDLTSACEHWQIARQIFWDGHEKVALADVDRRMMANGCPTDWVLNDF